MADDIPISDRHKNSVESLFAHSHAPRFFATHTRRNKQRITTPYRYKKGTQNHAYRYDTPLRSFIVAKLLTSVECCEDSARQKQSVINALHIYVLCPTRRFATASDYRKIILFWGDKQKNYCCIFLLQVLIVDNQDITKQFSKNVNFALKTLLKNVNFFIKFALLEKNDAL